MNVKNRYILLFLVVITLIAFYPTFNNGFTNWDDTDYIHDNELLNSLSGENLKKMFNTSVNGHFHPLTIITLAIEYSIRPLSAKLIHTNSLILHILDTLLVFWFILLLCKKKEVALIVALLFGIHPMHVESVAWVSERKDVLYTFFYISALITYLYALQKPGQKVKYMTFTLVLFVLALLSKTMAVTLPLAMLAIDYYKKRKFDKILIGEKLLFFLLSGAFFVWASSHSQFDNLALGYTFSSTIDRIFYAGYGTMMYLFKLVIPVNLSNYYPYPIKVDGQLPVIFYIAPAVILVLAFLAARTYKKTRTIVFGAVFFVVTIFLVIQLLPVGITLMADRYTYVSSIGLFFIFAIWFTNILGGAFVLRKKMKNVLIIGLVLYCSILTYSTIDRTKVWYDSTTLWTDVVEKFPETFYGYYARGKTYYDEKKFQLSVIDLDKAVQIDPTNLKAHLNRGMAHNELGNYNLAIQSFTSIINLRPDFSKAYFMRGTSYTDNGDYELALEDYYQCVDLDPNSIPARFNIAVTLYKMGRYQESIGDFTNMISILGNTPQSADLYYHRALGYYKVGYYNEAARDVQTARSMGYQADPKFLTQLSNALSGNFVN
ncbi:MAG: tetratricopeptide repeat protein [Bacteroidetes bacterium]|nr:tetratricopeptide repeat protein [Bacteroidota bacterium]